MAHIAYSCQAVFYKRDGKRAQGHPRKRWEGLGKGSLARSLMGENKGPFISARSHLSHSACNRWTLAQKQSLSWNKIYGRMMSSGWKTDDSKYRLLPLHDKHTRPHYNKSHLTYRTAYIVMIFSCLTRGKVMYRAMFPKMRCSVGGESRNRNKQQTMQWWYITRNTTNTSIYKYVSVLYYKQRSILHV